MEVERKPTDLYRVMAITKAMKMLKDEKFTKEEEILYDISCTLLGALVRSNKLNRDELHNEVLESVSKAMKGIDADIEINILKNTKGK